MDESSLADGGNFDQSHLYQQAVQTQKLQNQLQQLQSMQQEIVTHQTQLMNTLNVVNENKGDDQRGPSTSGTIHARQLSEDKIVPRRMGIDELKYCIIR